MGPCFQSPCDEGTRLTEYPAFGLDIRDKLSSSDLPIALGVGYDPRFLVHFE